LKWRKQNNRAARRQYKICGTRKWGQEKEEVTKRINEQEKIGKRKARAKSEVEVRGERHKEIKEK
jgi:hypothetical protein